MMTSAQFVFLSPSILNPPLARALGVGLSEVMIYNSLMGLAGVLAMTFLAPALFRKIGVRAAVVAGGLWMAATMGAVAFVTNVAVLYLLGFAAGLSFGVATTMAGSMLVNTWFESSRGTVMGGVFAVSGLGGIGAGLVLPALVSASGWSRASC
jgi:MFS family permease